MKNKNVVYSSFLAFFTSFLVLSCSSNFKTVRENKLKVKIALPDRAMKEKNKEVVLDTLPMRISYISPEGVPEYVLKNEADTVTGENIGTIALQGVTVVARTKSVPERNGKIDLGFAISVPKSLLSERWCLTLTPTALTKDSLEHFQEVVLKGKDFSKKQDKGYELWEKYQEGIIPDSLYNELFLNQEKVEQDIKKLREYYWNIYQTQLSTEELYSRWLRLMKRRYGIFNRKREEHCFSLRTKYDKEQELLEIRHELFSRVSEGLTAYYDTLYSRWTDLVPQYWLIRNLAENNVPSKWRARSIAGDTSLIQRREVASEDTIRIIQKHYKFGEEERNERLIASKEEVKSDLIRFPYNANARIDSIVDTGRDFNYYYTQAMPAREGVKRIRVTMEGEIQDFKGIACELAPSDTIDFFISSMLQFVDKAPRYLNKVIDRRVGVDMTAYLNFRAGQFNFDEKLGNNQSEMKKVKEMFHNLTWTGELLIDSIVMMASCSPEGSSVMNKRLSLDRANSIKAYLAQTFDDQSATDTLFTVKSLGEDWTTLKKLLVQNNHISRKTDILDAIDRYKNEDEREREIARLFPSDYRILRDSVYPHLRKVDFKFCLHRRDMQKDTIHTQVIDERYAEGIRLLQSYQYKEALQILSDYTDKNTVICLMSLGYNSRALELVSKYPVDSDTEYIKAILLKRLKRDGEAVSCYLNACRLDPSKIWRADLDPEINELVKNYNLEQKTKQYENY